ncbi:MAG: tyrosine-type recombinase/integrase, partial [Acidobacteriota bacterium]|nr:tyrosine-type recombinase/integrase [Acidobacteriota bacterium]
MGSSASTTALARARAKQTTTPSASAARDDKETERTSESIALRNAVSVWAESGTNAEAHEREKLIHDKTRTIFSFFDTSAKSPDAVKPLDVREWRTKMEREGLASNTVYTRISLLSSFYEWAMKQPRLKEYIRENPAASARPRRPKSYQTESTQSYTDEEMQAILAVVKSEADSGSVTAKRDYALLLLYLYSGMRRREVISLRGKDIDMKESGLIIRYRRKGGKYMARELEELDVVTAITAYLTAAGRETVYNSTRPLWTRHDHAGKPGASLTSHAFDKNLKRYAREAGVKNARIHRIRH